MIRAIKVDHNISFISIVKQIIWLIRNYKHYQQHRKRTLENLKQKFKPNTQKYFAVEYMLLYPTRVIQQGDVLYYCDKRRCETTNGVHCNYKDNSRAIESMRKDKFPLCWYEKIVNNELYFMYIPELKQLANDAIINEAKHKCDSFTKDIITQRVNQSNHKCELTGLSAGVSKLACDHFIPKNKGGLSTIDNCVVLNKVINEHKNKNEPIQWFCSTFMFNFMSLCKRAGILQQCKKEIKDYISKFD